MKLTYIFHSGFALETENCMLVFDYWLDPAHVIDEINKSGHHLSPFERYLETP